MGFFLVGRVAEDGSLNLISAKEFSARQEAIDELSKMAVDASLESEVFVVDLDVATPVLLVRQQPVDAPVEAEAPADAEVVDAREPEIEPSDDLTDALRRATGALEDAGVPAPESVGMPQGEDLSEPAAPPETDDLPSTKGAVTTEPTEDDGSWPWAKDGSDAEGYVLDSLEEPSAVDDDGILVHAKGDEDTVGLTRPVVMGEYADPEDTFAEEQQTLEGEPPPPPPAIEEPASPESSLSQQVEATPPPPPPAIDAEPSATTNNASILSDLEVPASPPLDASQKYAGEEIDLTSLTCEDCVYVNTCPNKADRQPGDCGSFQWKSA